MSNIDIFVCIVCVGILGIVPILLTMNSDIEEE